MPSSEIQAETRRKFAKKSHVRTYVYEEIFTLKDDLSKILYEHAPLTSVEVERSFLQVENILTN